MSKNKKTGIIGMIITIIILIIVVMLSNINIEDVAYVEGRSSENLLCQFKMVLLI